MSNTDAFAQRPEQMTAKQREFLALLETTLPALSRFCRAMCREGKGCDEERARDLISDTILKAFEHFEEVRAKQAFQSYLFTIAVRVNRHERVRQKRWIPFAPSDHEHIVDERNAPDANADTDALYTALAKLPKKQREAIVMSEIAGLSLAEVAETQSSSLSAVKSRVSRGRMKLAKLLGVESAATVAPEPKSVQSIQTFPSNGVSSNGKSTGHFNTRFAFQARGMNNNAPYKEKL